MRVGQPLEIVNSDPTLHNIHAMPKGNSEFNNGQPIQGMKMNHTFDKPEVMVPFKCDVHGWMNAYVGVMSHPYFAVTDEDGKFDLPNLPAGHLHDRSVAREARRADRQRDDRREGIEGRHLHLQAGRDRDELSARQAGEGRKAGRARKADPSGPPPSCPSCRSAVLPASMLHRFAKFLVACTVLLILAGSLVTSHDAGLSVPDWPTSYGWNMFTFPPSMWVANILYEHGHRLIASTVGFLTIIMAVWLWVADPRRWLRWFGVAALGSVIAQGLLGGLTVLFFLPAAVSTAHAGLAEIFFCMTVAIAHLHVAGLDRRLCVALRTPARTGLTAGPLRTLATTVTVLIYAQILVGATMRHTGAGLAIPDFPWMFGHVIPDHWSGAIAIHFTHRVGALLVTLGDPGALRARERALPRSPPS